MRRRENPWTELIALEEQAHTDEHLLALVESHIHAEASDLEGYRKLAGSSPDPVVAELMRLLVEDEERHHNILTRLAVTLRDDLNWERSPGALPPDRGPLDVDWRQALELVKGFIQHERRGVRYLSALVREAQGLRRWLTALLLETMVLDSQKHEMVLRHVAGRLERAHKARG